MTRHPYLLAGNRQLAVDVLRMLISEGDPPEVLCVSAGRSASHQDELIANFRRAGGRWVLTSSELRDAQQRARLREANLDFALSVHFPHIIDEDLLSVPQRGWLNLHPAYLPWNRGWHTPSWAILDGTPVGATLHRMTDAVDAGEVLVRRRVSIERDDTAHTLYLRLLQEELRLIAESWETVRSDQWPSIPNPVDEGTVHRRADLVSQAVQRIDLDRSYPARVLIDRLRALTTSEPSEAAYFEEGGQRYRVQVEITPEESQ